MATADEIKNALYVVFDPELGLNVVDLGLIYDVQSDDQSVTITMTLTTPGCPIHESMISAVKSVIGALEPLKRVDVNLVWEPAWTPEMMSSDARRSLGW